MLNLIILCSSTAAVHSTLSTWCKNYYDSAAIVFRALHSVKQHSSL